MGYGGLRVRLPKDIQAALQQRTRNFGVQFRRDPSQMAASYLRSVQTPGEVPSSERYLGTSEFTRGSTVRRGRQRLGTQLGGGVSDSLREQAERVQGPHMAGPQPNQDGYTTLNPLEGYGGYMRDGQLYDYSPLQGPAWQGPAGQRAAPQEQGPAGSSFFDRDRGYSRDSVDVQSWVTEELYAERDAKFAMYQQAYQLNAQIAAEKYRVEIAQLDRELEVALGQQAAMAGAWSNWKTEMLGVLSGQADKATDAYAEYMAKVAAGYDEYDALVTSRWGAYRDEVKSLLGTYMQETGEDYDSVIGSLPGIWQPVVAAIAEDREENVATIAATRQRRRASVEGQLVESSEFLREKMAAIGHDNQALHDELMEEIRLAADLQARTIDADEANDLAINQALANVATRTVEWELQKGLYELSTQKAQVIADAKRQEYTLLRRADAQQDQLLEGSAFNREQTLQQIQYQLDSYLTGITDLENELISNADYERQRMEYELAQRLQGLTDGRSQVEAAQASELQQLATEFLLNTGNEYADWDQITFAEQYMNSELEGLGLNQHDRERVAAQIQQMFADPAFTHVRTPADYEALVAQQRENYDAAMAQYDAALKAAGNNVTDPFVLELWENLPDQPPPAEHVAGVMKGLMAYNAALEHFTVFNAENPSFVNPLPGAQLPGQGTMGDYGFVDPHGIIRGGRTHGGIDLSAPMYTPIRAAAPGVVKVSAEGDLNGWFIEVDHGGGWVSHYLHMAEQSPLKTGDRVTLGQVIGRVGETGNASGPHLHFSLSQYGRRQNPMLYLGGGG